MRNATPMIRLHETRQDDMKLVGSSAAVALAPGGNVLCWGFSLVRRAGSRRHGEGNAAAHRRMVAKAGRRSWLAR
jgi:hypothetical protein